MNGGCILPEPDIPDMERWGTAMGVDRYPFVRSIGGVSLFDFRGFEESEYEKNYPVSSWLEFVPCRSKNDSAVWIEINLSQIEEHFIDGSTLLAEWKKSGQQYRKIMPQIEAAHIGPIGINAFRKVLLYQKYSNTFESLSH